MFLLSDFRFGAIDGARAIEPFAATGSTRFAGAAIELTGGDDDKIPPDRLQIFLTKFAEVEEACHAAHALMLALVAGQAQQVA